MRIQRWVSAATALLFVTACGGQVSQVVPSSSGSAGVRGGVGGTAAAKRGRAKLELRLKIPRRHRRGHYVSPSTQSIAILQGSKTLGTFNTTASSGNCSAVNGGTLCTFKLGILSGANQTFTVNTYDLPGGAAGGGKLLSAGRVTKTIAAGLNVIPVTLDGVIASIVVAVQNPNAPAGTAVTNGVTVMANDPDGNTIVGPGTYNVAIALSDTDSVATTLSATTVNGPNDRITLAYNGKSLTSATIGAAATGIAPASITAGRFAPTPVAVSDFQLGTSIGSNTGVGLQPVAIANGSDGNLWFSVEATGGSPRYAIVRMTTSGAMTTFAPGTAPSTNLPDDFFNGLALGSDGNVWYAADSNVGNIAASGATNNYPLSGLGLCAGANAERMTPAQDGGLWVTIGCSSGSQLLHLSTAGTPTANTLPANFEEPNALVVGKDGHVYVAGKDSNNSLGAILQATVSGGTVAGTPAIADVPSGALNTISILQGITQSADGDIWATNGGCAPSAIVRLHLAAGFSTSAMTAFPTLAGCADPAYLRALPDGSIWVAEDDYPEALQIVPSSTGGAPSLFALTLPTPNDVYGETLDVATGSDGNLYFTNNSYNSGVSPNQSGSIVKVVY
jgi:hypothetical protein